MNQTLIIHNYNMRKLISTKYSAGAFNFAIFVLRVGLGVLMMMHGYEKLTHFTEIQPKFLNFIGLGQSASLAMVIFAEFFCSLFLILGLFTRLACIPLIITMAVALFQVHHSDIFKTGEPASLFLLGYIVLIFLGAGRVSVDSMIAK